MSKLGALLFASSEEGGQLKNNSEFSCLHNETLLRNFSRSTQGSTIVLIVVTVTVALILYLQTGSAPVILWAFLVSFTQIPRLLLSGWFANSSIKSDKIRLIVAQSIAIVSGSGLASVLVFAPQMTIETRFLVSMLLVGFAATGIVTNCGFKRFSLSFVVPIFVAVVCIWFFDPDDTVSRSVYWLAMLVLAQIVVCLLVLNRQVYGSFLSNLYAQHRLTLALDSELSESTAKTRLLTAASHELRQPLHALSLFCSALALRPLDEDSKAIALKMDKSVRALNQEIESLFDIFKLDADAVSINKNIINLSTLVKTVCEYLEPRAALKNLDLIVNSSADIYVETDVDLFSGILRNLLDRVIKCTLVGGVGVDLTVHNGQAILRVQHTGIGASGDKTAKVREENYQEKNSAVETEKDPRLELSVVKRISDLLQVKVDLKSVGIAGTCFEITLPQYIP